MASEPGRAPASHAASWRDLLDELERSLRDASRAVGRLRQRLEDGGDSAVSSPLSRAFEPIAPSDLKAPSRLEHEATAPEVVSGDTKPPVEMADRLAAFERARSSLGAPNAGDAEAREVDAETEGDSVLSPAERSARLSAFERVWERIERERVEQGVEARPEPAKERHGVELLPQQYLITVEDKESRVDLAPLHRALLTLAPADDISLVSFAKGVPVISLRTQGELDMERLREAVAAATGRGCDVIPQDNGRIFLRLAPVEEET
jgi:hypothetical protein